QHVGDIGGQQRVCLRSHSEKNACSSPAGRSQYGKEQRGGTGAALPAQRHPDGQRGVQRERKAVAPNGSSGEILGSHWITPRAAWIPDRWAWRSARERSEWSCIS